jgi:hypothetical protein
MTYIPKIRFIYNILFSRLLSRSLGVLIGRFPITTFARRIIRFRTSGEIYFSVYYSVLSKCEILSEACH